MNRIGISLLLLLVLGSASGAEPYELKPLSEQETMNTYNSLLRDACHHADQFWRDWAVGSSRRFLGQRRSDQQNEGFAPLRKWS